MAAPISVRGTALPAKLRAFVADHVEIFGTKHTAKRLGCSTDTVRGMLRGYRAETRTALRILELAKLLGADRQRWLRDLPEEPPPPARSHARHVAKIPPAAPEPPRQSSLF